MEMIYRRLGKSGLRLSALSFGSWVTFHTQLEVNAAADCMKVAYDAGVNFFDNAEVYAQGESEIIMGKVLRDMGWGRDTYCVSSKVYWGGQLPTQRGLHKKHVHDACHAALKRLQVDYLDLFSVIDRICTHRSKKRSARCIRSLNKARSSIGELRNGMRNRSQKPMPWQPNST